MKFVFAILCCLPYWCHATSTKTAQNVAIAGAIKGRKQAKEQVNVRRLKKKGKNDNEGGDLEGFFQRVATFPICSQLDPTCNVDTETNAEIVTASPDGMMVAYTDSGLGAIGFVDISDPSNPVGLGFDDSLGGEPTSAVWLSSGQILVVVNTSPDFVNPSGTLLVFTFDDSTNTINKESTTFDLGGQPDAVDVSPDGNYVAIAIENERDEDLGDGSPPQMPAGFLYILDVLGDTDPNNWASRTVDLTGLDGVAFPSDPEPEFVSINPNNIAVVTLQENNALVLVNLVTGMVVNSFTAGTVDLTDIDVTEEDIIEQNGSLFGVPREPDAVTWLFGGNDFFATADEGDLDGGSRGFTIYNKDGDVVYSSGSLLEKIAVQIGHYPDARSENKGNEPETVKYGKYGDTDLLFILSERSNVIFVFDITDDLLYEPLFVQVLPSGVGPEGAAIVSSRNLLVIANEVDSRDDKIRGSLTIYQLDGKFQNLYPTIVSDNSKADGLPIPFSALSALSVDAKDDEILWSIEDSFYKSTRIFEICVEDFPARVEKELLISDKDKVFANFLASQGPSEDFSALLLNNDDDKTVNIDGEGIVDSGEGYFWVASEGRGTVGDAGRPVESRNYLLCITKKKGIIEQVVTLPPEVNDIQVRFGFEGVTVAGKKARYVVAAIQRAWLGEANPRIAIWDTKDEVWSFIFYPLDAPESQNGGWVGIGDITYVGDDKFVVLERDNQGGPDAAIKKIYLVEGILMDAVVHGSGATIPTIRTKTLVKDLIPDLLTPNGFVYEKLEGLAVTSDGDVWVVNDNDGVDDNSGEIQLLMVGEHLVDKKDD